MCLGIPMQIRDITGSTARCEARGVERDVSLFMLQDRPAVIGDYVMVHVGYAIQIIAPDVARSARDLDDAIQAGCRPDDR